MYFKEVEREELEQSLAKVREGSSLISYENISWVKGAAFNHDSDRYLKLSADSSQKISPS